MSGDEFFLSIMAGIVAMVAWVPWYADLARINRMGSRGHERAWLALCPIAGVGIIVVVIAEMAAKEVRSSSEYTAMYLLLGAAWMGVVASVTQWQGISVRDDVVERRNGAALWPSVSVILGAAIMYAGGNVGEGPGVEAVLTSAGLATGLWLVLWSTYEQFTSAAEKVTVDRDVTAGWKLAALLMGNAVILGVAASGDWIPGKVLSGFFSVGKYAMIVTAMAALVDRNTDRAWPGALYVTAGVIVGILGFEGRL